MGQTLAQKILSRIVGRSVEIGEIIMPEAELVTVHDWYAANAARALDEVGVTELFDPARVMFTTDHEPVAVSPHAAERQQRVREIAARLGIGHFFDVGRGGQGHVFPVELGYIRPGMYIAGYDTHVTNFGAVGALGIAVLTEVSELMALGSVWQQVPQTVRINLHGQLPAGISIRDVAQKIIGELDPDLIDDAVVEFAGPGLRHIGIDGRFTLVNTPTELGARSAIVEPDEIVRAYLADRVDGPVELPRSDPDAPFRAVIEWDMALMEPQVAAPPRPDRVVGVSQVSGTRIDHAYIGSCASGMIEDMRETARFLKGRVIHPRVRLFITPATNRVAAQMAEESLTGIIQASGAVLTPPGCGVCAGGRIGPVAPGEVSIGTGTRNDPGRLGAHDAQLYIASPATVAAAAITGEICDPRGLDPDLQPREAAHD